MPNTSGTSDRATDGLASAGDLYRKITGTVRCRGAVVHRDMGRSALPFSCATQIFVNAFQPAQRATSSQ